VTPAQAGSIDKVRERMQQNPGKKLSIEGHSDDLGALDYNQQLSEQRAESAKAALVRAGIPAERIETRGFGPTRPLVQGTSPEARAQNRRVEFVLHD
jgi:outer membrane protein OmpA-like peptidoglycan-associated protein